MSDAFTATHKTNDALTTLGSFVTGLKARPGVSAPAVDALLAHSGIGPITTSFGDGDAWLRAFYVTVPSLPLNATVTLDGREAFNFVSQNKVWVLTGNGARITVTANSASDVGVAATLRGVEVGASDTLTTGGTESFSFNSTSGTTYVVSLTGYGASMGLYSATVAITSP